MTRDRSLVALAGRLLAACAFAVLAAAPARAADPTNVTAAISPGAIPPLTVTPAPLVAPKPDLPPKPEMQPLSPADLRIQALGIDPAGITQAIAAYRSGKLDDGDSLAAKVHDATARATLEWVALREAPQRVSLGRLEAFATAHPGWPASAWLRHEMEAHLVLLGNPVFVETFFTERAPETPPGKLTLAHALRATGRTADATRLARAVFRESDLTGSAEAMLKVEFGNDLTRNDYKYRADRLLYKGRIGAALHAAAQAGPDLLALTRAKAAVIAEAPSDAAIAAVPALWRDDPGLVLAKAQKLRRAGRLIEAAQMIETAPHDTRVLIDGDAWWTERRTLARKLLDAGKVNAAYVMCAMATPSSADSKVEAEFMAGWIALRYLGEPQRAAFHLDVAAKVAEAPNAIARIAYWRGRVAEMTVDPAALVQAHDYYTKAAVHGATYYGQLAREALGLGPDLVRYEEKAALGAERDDAVRVIELLYAAGDRDAADNLAADAARTMGTPAQVAALAAVVAAQQDAHLAVTVGKLVAQRSIRIDPLAFPTFGIPLYKPLGHSAPQPIVYAVARQESAFMTHAVSRAGAKGLMQMILPTARQTALRAGVHFDGVRLLRDASFNAQLGAEHLGTLMQGNGGSLILTFAEYNAGGGRVKQWIDAYGDPRKPGVDPIDWVERIPITETRDYVQRVVANTAMYSAMLSEKPVLSAEVEVPRLSTVPSVVPLLVPVAATTPSAPMLPTHL